MNHEEEKDECMPVARELTMEEKIRILNSSFSSHKEAYFKKVYLDDNDNVVSEADATHVIITTYDSEDKVLNTIYGVCNNSNR